MRFTKMHGIGNDYIYMDCVRGPMPKDPAALSRKVSNRNTGIGGDGLILICPSEKADARMRMFNADGSESEMCGNGVRCVAKFVHDHGIARKPTLKIETGSGVLTLDLEIVGGKVSQVRVDMGEPILESSLIPTTLGVGRVVNHPWPFSELSAEEAWAKECGLNPRITCVSMGNPHVILYCKDVRKVPLERVGPIVERASIFPRRINVHFVQVENPGEVTMRTWERGSGITLACGTGACSVAVGGVLTEKTDRQLLAHLPGGDLHLNWEKSDNRVYMTGPSEEVFSGEWPEEV